MKNISRQFLFVICLCLVNLTSLAASFNEKISLVLKVPNENLRTLAGQNSLIINFCEITANSQQAKDLCTKPSKSLQISGQNINEQVSITPNIDGDWRGGWNYNINFTPTNNFLANQTYKVTINTKDIFPDFISLKSDNISFKTLPLLPIIKDMNYLQDNSAEPKKIVQAQIIFNYPIDPTTLKERIEIIQASNKEKLPFELKFNQQNTEAIVIANIKKLGVNEDIVSLNIKDGVKLLYGGEDFFHKNVEKQNNSPANNIANSRKYSYNDQVLIPSLSSYLKVSNATAVIVKNQKLVPEQMVIITTNAPVSSMDLKNHLELFLLPEDKPNSLYGALDSKNYKWKSPIEITEDILNLSEKIEFELLPTSSENNTTHSFKIEVPEHKYLLLIINKGVKGQEGLILGQNYTQIARIPANLQEVKLMSNGSILSLVGEKKLSVYSIGIDTLSVEIDKINQEDINHLVSQTKQYNTFQNPTFINKYSFNEYNISEVFREDIIIDPEDSNIPSYTTLDFRGFARNFSNDYLAYS